MQNNYGMPCFVFGVFFEKNLCINLYTAINWAVKSEKWNNESYNGGRHNNYPMKSKQHSTIEQRYTFGWYIGRTVYSEKRHSSSFDCDGRSVERTSKMKGSRTIWKKRKKKQPRVQCLHGIIFREIVNRFI